MTEARTSYLQIQDILLYFASTHTFTLDFFGQKSPASTHSSTDIEGFLIRKPWEIKGTGWLTPIHTRDHSLPLGETTRGKSEQHYPGCTWTGEVAGSERSPCTGWC